MQPAKIHGLLADRRGAVFVEQLIVFVPVLFFILVTLQLIELFTGQLVVRRAASAAARAAVVVLPDNKAYYDGVPENSPTGKRLAEVQQAASMILKANSHFANPEAASVGFEGSLSGNSRVTVTVGADFHCFASFVSVVCGGASRRLTASATYMYHGARYVY